MSYQCGFPLTPNQQHGMVPCNTVAVPPTMSPRPSIVVPPPRSLTDAAATNPMEVFSADRLEWSREEMNDTDSFDKLKDLLTVKSAVRNESQCECNHRLRLAKNIVEMKKAEGLEIIRAHQKQQQFWKNAKNWPRKGENSTIFFDRWKICRFQMKLHQIGYMHPHSPHATQQPVHRLTEAQFGSMESMGANGMSVGVVVKGRGVGMTMGRILMRLSIFCCSLSRFLLSMEMWQWVDSAICSPWVRIWWI